MPLRFDMPGPIDVPQETSSGLDLLPTNTTLIAMPFKGADGPRRPEEIPKEFAGSTEQVMEYTQPKVKVKLKTGNPANPEADETINFQGGVEAFSPRSIKENSPVLRRLQAEFSASDALIDRIDKVPQFRKAMDDPNARMAAIAMLQQVIDELTASLPAEEEA
ncbi:MAG: hypothetical protein AAF828_00675 [Bacteroidota bacterium]